MPYRAFAEAFYQVIPIVLTLVVLVAVVEYALYLLLVRTLNLKYAIPYMLIVPSAMGLAVFVAYPLFYSVYMAFTNLNLYHLRNFHASLAFGAKNFQAVFSGPLMFEIPNSTFVTLLGRTILWTVINVFFHVTLGVAIALLLNRELRGKGIYRTILVLPWAIPQVIAALSFRGEFNSQFGVYDVLLGRFHNFLAGIGLGPLANLVQPIPWLQEQWPAFAAVCLTNIWLGVPFMMIIALGGLQSIAGDYYEAAEIDGGSAWQQFWYITVPLLRPVMVPAIIIGAVWTFNNVNIPYLIVQGDVPGAADTLATAIYRAAFEYSQYGVAAATALVVFFGLFVFSGLFLRFTGGLKGIYE